MRRIANFAFRRRSLRSSPYRHLRFQWCVPVSSVSARITEPPLPITSLILSGLILMGVNTRSEFGDITAWRVDSLFHHARMCRRAPFAVQSNLHDLFGDTFNFDIHLQCRTVAGTATLKSISPGGLRRPECQTEQQSCRPLSPAPLRYPRL